jgi:hypothetical protein
VQEDRTKPIHADSVPDMDSDPDPGPQQHLTDTQGNDIEGIVIALSSLQASFMAVSGRSGNNSFQRFNGRYRDFPGFKKCWLTHQEIHYASAPNWQLSDIFHDNCLEKEAADKIQKEGTIAGCWKILDTFYDHPLQFT